MKTYNRILISISVLLLIPLYFVPIWRIDLIAPQYPEGIGIKIWLTKFSGNVESINNLNHYIGMAHIDNTMFPEFVYLPYVLAGVLAIGVWAAISKKLAWSVVWAATLSLFGLFAMVDMYLWGYDYGHNLDPMAAIKVEGMAYQPPLIGYKKLLNFEAYSLPDTGGYLLAAALVLALFVCLNQWLKNRKSDALKQPI